MKYGKKFMDTTISTRNMYGKKVMDTAKKETNFIKIAGKKYCSKIC